MADEAGHEAGAGPGRGDAQPLDEVLHRAGDVDQSSAPGGHGEDVRVGIHRLQPELGARVFRVGLGEALDGGPELAVRLLGGEDLEHEVEVAPPAALQRRHALALEPELPAGLAVGRDGDGDLPGEGGRADLRAEHRLGHGDRQRRGRGRRPRAGPADAGRPAPRGRGPPEARPGRRPPPGPRRAPASRSARRGESSPSPGWCPGRGPSRRRRRTVARPSPSRRRWGRCG